jgi:hypothetical protein
MEQKDERLWRQAKRRVGFRNHLITYLIVNAFLWTLWFLTDYRRGEFGLPWPTFCTLGWGVGLMFNFFGAYVITDKYSQIEREYEKLKNRS